jgi:hypothetical protein
MAAAKNSSLTTFADDCCARCGPIGPMSRASSCSALSQSCLPQSADAGRRPTISEGRACRRGRSRWRLPYAARALARRALGRRTHNLRWLAS